MIRKVYRDDFMTHTQIKVRFKDSRVSVDSDPRHVHRFLPDLAPCDFCLLPKLKKPLKGRRFDDVEAIKQNAT